MIDFFLGILEDKNYKTKVNDDVAIQMFGLLPGSRLFLFRRVLEFLYHFLETQGTHAMSEPEQ